MSIEQSKPAGRMVARALSNRSGGGFVAQFAVPGMIPAIVCDDSSGEPTLFDHADEAEVAALRAAFERYNSPRAQTLKRIKRQKARAKRLTNLEFTQLLNEVRLIYGVPEGFFTFEEFFAYICQTNPARVQDWIDGKQDRPHYVRVLLEIFKEDSAMLDFADAVTTDALEE